MKQQNRKQFIWLVGIVFVIALVRLINLPIPNFSPIGAMALFGAAYFRNKYAGILVPLASLFVSDVILELVNGTGFHGTMVFVYGSFLLIGMIGWLLRNHTTALTLAVSGLAASILFYLVTNFGVWAMGTWYPHDLNGLMLSYEMGLPFFRYTLLGNLFYISLLFGLYEGVIKKKVPAFAGQ